MANVAERYGTSLSCLAAAVTGMALFATSSGPAVSAPAEIITELTTVPPTQVATEPMPGEACPAFARARLHLDSDAIVTCAHGNFSEPGYVVHAAYHTTEWWERIGVVADDGSHDLVPFIDRPTLERSYKSERHDAYVTTLDVDDDGIDEVIVMSPERSVVEVMAIGGDGLATKAGPCAGTLWLHRPSGPLVIEPAKGDARCDVEWIDAGH